MTATEHSSRAAVAVMLGFLACARAAGPEIIEDPPSIGPSKSGDLVGTITPVEQVQSLSAVSRVTGKRYSPSDFEKRTGRFVFTDMPGDARYDICLTTVDGRRIEGIDLGWVEARLDRLAEIRRRELGLPAKPARDFTYEAGGWVKQDNTERVLERKRISRAEWSRITLVYEAELSILVDFEGKSTPIRYEIRRDLAQSKGRLANTLPALKTKTNVLGVAQATTSPRE